MTNARETVQIVGESLTAFLKSGPESRDHLQETKTKISELTRSIALSADDAAASYERVCREFLDKIILVKGIPTRKISGDRGSQSDLVSSSGKAIAEKFDTLLPSIKERYKWCVTNYKSEATAYLDEQLHQCDVRIGDFLEQIPTGGTKDKEIKSRIVEIKKEIRSLAKWDQIFYTNKAMSFPAEVEFLFSLQSNPLAAIWRYNPIDEQTDYPKTYNHKQRADLVYAVRGNWAIEKGLMKVGPAGYLDEISRPGQEIGCMCFLQLVTSVRRLPDSMITDKGRSELDRVTAVIQSEKKPEQKPQPAASDAKLIVQKRRFLHWLGFRGG